MSVAPRLEIRLDRIEHNAATLVARLASRGISVTGVTKATLGSPEVARAMLRGGVTGIGESRIENIERLRAAGVDAVMTLIRSPMPSQAARVVAAADVSMNTEVSVLEALSVAAGVQGRAHGVILMVELGDLREGLIAEDLPAVVERVLALPHLALHGIGTNLACQSGVTPDEQNMAVLSVLAAGIEDRFGVTLETVSGGNSANLGWAFATPDAGRVDDLRLGESILLGCEPLQRTPVAGLHTDCFAVVAEVIEAKVKPTRPWGAINQTAFGAQDAPLDTGSTCRAILALGRQDVDPDGLRPPRGMTILGASSDHLVLDVGDADCPVGSEVAFGVDYAALLRAATSPFVERHFGDAADPSDL